MNRVNGSVNSPNLNIIYHVNNVPSETTGASQSASSSAVRTRSGDDTDEGKKGSRKQKGTGGVKKEPLVRPSVDFKKKLFSKIRLQTYIWQDWKAYKLRQNSERTKKAWNKVVNLVKKATKDEKKTPKVCRALCEDIWIRHVNLYKRWLTRKTTKPPMNRLLLPALKFMEQQLTSSKQTSTSTNSGGNGGAGPSHTASSTATNSDGNDGADPTQASSTPTMPTLAAVATLNVSLQA